MDISILTHIARIIHGIGATVACASAFYIAGFLLLPRRWNERLASMTPGIVGSALYVISCWFAVGAGVPVARVVTLFALVVVLGGAIRYRRFVSLIRERAFVRAAGASLLTFSLLYVLAYLFTRPPATSEYLPVAWLGNIDLMTYVRYTRYFLSLGPANLPDFTYFNFVYLQTPGLFYLFGALSLLFHLDPLSAAMPIQFALTALIGTLIAAISRSVFKLPAPAAFGIACICISGPFFRYVAAQYYLSTLMAMPVMLYLLAATVEQRARMIDGPLIVQFAAGYVLLLMIYPFLLLATLGLQVGVLIVMLVCGLLQPRDHHVGRGAAGHRAGATLAAAVASFVAVALSFSTHLKWSVAMIVSLSEKGVAGWPLYLIPPQAMFAVPGTTSSAIQSPVEPGPWGLIAYAGIAIVLLIVVFSRWPRLRLTPEQNAFAGLLAAAVILYCVYYTAIGHSYQQWKFASYSVLPLVFVAYAVTLRLLSDSRVFGLVNSPDSDRRFAASLVFVGAVMVGGNLVVQATGDLPMFLLPGASRRIADINRMPEFSEITIRMVEGDRALPTWVALYYLPSKKVHVVSSMFSPSAPLSVDQVSRYRPLLIDNFDCYGVGHQETMTIEGVGCLVFAPPSPLLDETYPFGRTYFFLDFEGLARRLPEGRWSNRPTVQLRITADPERIAGARDLYLNLLLKQDRSEGRNLQPVIFRFGSGLRGERAVGNGDWVSLPVQSTEWVGNRVWTLALFLDMPDNGSVLFENLSLSATPKGDLVQMPAS